MLSDPFPKTSLTPPAYMIFEGTPTRPTPLVKGLQKSVWKALLMVPFLNQSCTMHSLPFIHETLHNHTTWCWVARSGKATMIQSLFTCPSPQQEPSSAWQFMYRKQSCLDSRSGPSSVAGLKQWVLYTLLHIYIYICMYIPLGSKILHAPNLIFGNYLGPQCIMKHFWIHPLCTPNVLNIVGEFYWDWV